MPRRARQAPGGLIYRVLNRGNGRQDIFHTDADAAAFLRVLKEAKELVPVELLAFCLMSNHWHLVLWPREEGDLSRFMFWLTNTHVRRYRLFSHSVGGGHLYQSRFKSFAVQDDEHLLTVLGYVEANPLRAGMVARAADWRWSSLRHWLDGDPMHLLDVWPAARPPDWAEWVDAALPETALTRLRHSLETGRPFGRGDWLARAADLLGFELVSRRRGRPRKSENQPQAEEQQQLQ